MRKDRLDVFGFLAILMVTLFFSFNQMIIKETTIGLQPVFFAGLRSALAVVFVLGWLWYRGLLDRVLWADTGAGLAIGLVFSIEFLGLFIALDLTAVSRAAIIFYSMPVWFAIIAHFGLPGERLTRLRLIGLLIAFCGTGLAILSRDTGGQGNLIGDLCALMGAFGWAGTAYLARATNLRIRGPEVQLFWMVAVSAVILLLVAPLFGPLLREIEPIHWFWLVFQAGIVVTAGFILWLFLLSAYPSATVTSFSFLTPIFSILLGHFVYGEVITAQIIIATLLVGAGILLINRRK
jgi:drug/metabolite transporter (DMT)-like permease